MKQDQVTATQHYSPRATLVAIGMKIRSLKLLQPIVEEVKIRQKTVKHTPVEKLTDALITILAGAHGLSEINTRLRSDAALRACVRAKGLCRAIHGAGDTRCLPRGQRQANGASDQDDLSHPQSGFPPRLSAGVADSGRGYDRSALRVASGEGG